jgi:hypothetical protein
MISALGVFPSKPRPGCGGLGRGEGLNNGISDLRAAATFDLNNRILIAER